MKEVSGFNKTLRHLAIALMCVFAVFAVLPAGIGAKTGLIVKAEAATSKTCVVGQAGRFTTSASGTLRWSSSKPSVLKVTQSGQFTALKAGTATVTLSINGRKRGTCYVTVKRNILRFKTSSGGRNSGFYTVMQDGTLKPSFCIKPVYIEFLSRQQS